MKPVCISALMAVSRRFCLFWLHLDVNACFIMRWHYLCSMERLSRWDVRTPINIKLPYVRETKKSSYIPNSKKHHTNIINDLLSSACVHTLLLHFSSHQSTQAHCFYYSTFHIESNPVERNFSSANRKKVC